MKYTISVHDDGGEWDDSVMIGAPDPEDYDDDPEGLADAVLSWAEQSAVDTESVTVYVCDAETEEILADRELTVETEE